MSTSRCILLLRHAKSDWSAQYSGDHERPLASRGQRAAATMGRFLAAAGPKPDHILCSSAVRARNTVQLMAEAAGWTDHPDWSSRFEISPKLYHAGPQELLEEIRTTAYAVRTLMLVGHEPTWSDLAGRLLGSGDLRLPTAALLRLDFGLLPWSQVDFGRGELRWLVTPKLLQKAGLS